MTDPSVDHVAEGHSDPIAFQQYDITDTTRARSAITEYDYSDQFTLLTEAAATWAPEAWARAALDTVAGSKGQLIWRGLLGLRLARRSAPAQVAGWPVVESGDSWITLAARSWMLTGSLVIEIEENSVSLATFVRYERPVGERIWKRASQGHRRFAPELLPDAQRVLRQLP
ncbi:hypothetical protein [Nocardia speluncae]|uniref:hypothetical protein n=1 Tax=Nocardia speluncae TaxID=419477 RepID=UPI00082F572B|nr:hypothetical protein [Nocardia speluncae]